MTDHHRPINSRGARYKQTWTRHWIASLVAAIGFLSFTGQSAEAETRSLKLYHIHTGERTEIAFKRDGRYDKAGLKKISYALRDWRTNQPTTMDPRLLDLIWEAYRQSGATGYISVVGGYRSPATNAMLRSRSKGVAEKSQHMRGNAMDFFIPGVKLNTLREIGLKMQGGGVGYYPSSGSPFVHFDVGNVRHWPKMSRKELVALFPNGKTLHVPSDGRPLPGFEQALASYKSRKGSGELVIASAHPTAEPEKPLDRQSGKIGANTFVELVSSAPIPSRRPDLSTEEPASETSPAVVLAYAEQPSTSMILPASTGKPLLQPSVAALAKAFASDELVRKSAFHLSETGSTPGTPSGTERKSVAVASLERSSAVSAMSDPSSSYVDDGELPAEASSGARTTRKAERLLGQRFGAGTVSVPLPAQPIAARWAIDVASISSRKDGVRAPAFTYNLVRAAGREIYTTRFQRDIRSVQADRFSNGTASFLSSPDSQTD